MGQYLIHLMLAILVVQMYIIQLILGNILPQIDKTKHFNLWAWVAGTALTFCNVAVLVASFIL